MKTEITLTESIGKTLKDVALPLFSEQCVLTFTDGTFVTLVAENEYGDMGIREGRLDPFNFGDEELIRVGVVTAEELTALRKVREDRRLADNNRWERSQFELLKKKFEGQ